MILLPKHKMVFVDVPRTATTSLELMLCSFHNGFTCGRHQQRTPVWRDGWDHFAVVRNPYDRAVSMWRHITQVRMTPGRGYRRRWADAVKGYEFSDWVRYLGSPDKNFWARSQTEYLKPWRNIHLQLLRFENLTDDLDRLTPFSSDSLTHLNKSEGKDDPYTPELREAVRKWAREDFERWGYEP